MTRHASIPSALVVTLALSLCACGDDDGDDGDGNGPQPEGGMVTMDAASARGDAATSSPGDASPPEMRDTAPPTQTPMTCEPSGGCDPFDDAGACGDEACQLGASGLGCGAINAGAGNEGDACDFPGDCRAGLACMALTGGTQCVRLCPLGSIGHCGDEASCSGTTSADCVGFCRALPPPCDIFAQDCDDADDACTLAINEETDERYTGCMPAGSGAQGDSCQNVGGCGKGLICVGNECVQVCQSGDAGSLGCSGGRRCSGRSASWDVPYCR